jgi:hypothetical protein
VLPIRYRLSADGAAFADEADAVPHDRDSWEYRKIEPEELGSIWRRSAYFTVDTSYALFRRAQWLQLENTAKDGKSKDIPWTSFSYVAPPVTRNKECYASAREITVEIDPPMIVLFEAENAWKAFDWQAKPEETFFQVGFLYLDCHLRTENGENKTGVCLEDLLEFNERVRCIWSPYRVYIEDYMRVMGRCVHLWPDFHKRRADCRYKLLRGFDNTDDLAESIKRLQEGRITGVQEKRVGRSAGVAVESSKEKDDRDKRVATGIICSGFGNALGLWAAALGYPLKTSDGKKCWLNDKWMRDNARIWMENCAVAHAREDGAAGNKRPIPISESDTETNTGWLATTDYRVFVWTYANTSGVLACIIREA